MFLKIELLHILLNQLSLPHDYCEEIRMSFNFSMTSPFALKCRTTKNTLPTSFVNSNKNYCDICKGINDEGKFNNVKKKLIMIKESCKAFCCWM